MYINQLNQLTVPQIYRLLIQLEQQYHNLMVSFSSKLMELMLLVKSGQKQVITSYKKLLQVLQIKIMVLRIMHILVSLPLHLEILQKRLSKLTKMVMNQVKPIMLSVILHLMANQKLRKLIIMIKQRNQLMLFLKCLMNPESQSIQLKQIKMVLLEQNYYRLGNIH